MKKITLFVLVLTILVLITSACEINMVSGSGKVITKTRSVSGFTSVNFAGLGELSITQGATEGLSIEAEDNILERIKTEVKNGVLFIGFDNESWQNVVRPTRSIKFDLKVKNLNNLDLSGVGNVTLPKLSAEALTIKVSGAGGVKIDALTATSINCNMSGAGNVDIAGKVTSQSITMGGLGNYAGGDLQSQSASITLTGAGGATVWARDTLNVKISGAGSVSYYGTPKITKDVSGLGVINSQGAK